MVFAYAAFMFGMLGFIFSIKCLRRIKNVEYDLEQFKKEKKQKFEN